MTKDHLILVMIKAFRAQAIEGVDTHEEQAVRVNVRGVTYRVSINNLMVEEANNGVLISSDRAYFVGEILKRVHAELTAQGKLK